MTKKNLDSDLEEIKEELLAYIPNANIAVVEKAYKLAQEAHEGQKRKSGKPYLVHPIGVAKLLLEIRVSSNTIVAALLHDVIEESGVTQDDIKKDFGSEIESIVESLTKLDKIERANIENYNAENLRKIILATSKDIRVMLVKLADRLHNMRSLEYLPLEKQKRIASETMQIYAPIAHKIGMWRWGAELEDLCLKYLKPEAYEFLRKKINQKKTQREKKAKEIIKQVKKKLKENNIEADVYGRVKHFFSIYRKMVKRKVDFNEIYDLIAIRIITKTIPDCYIILGLIHDLFRPIPGRVKDYISVPKANGYQSIHTTVVGRHGKILEFQIRTERMHQFCENGVAAHWRYHGKERDKVFDKKIGWLKQILEWQKNYDDAMDFIEDFKFDLFENEIVVFTPKGDPISLPEGSTPVDFAYAIHTNIGNTCSQAMVNNVSVPLNTKLSSGDIVSIIVSKNSVPSRNWLKFAKTNQARNKIRNKLGITAEAEGRRERPQKKKNAKMSDVSLRKKLDVGKAKGAVKFSKCCNPGYGDEIRAFKARNGRITVHKADCDNILAFDDQREIDVSWISEEKKDFLTILVNVVDRVGMLGEILNVLAKNKINLSRINFKQSSQNNVKITLKVKNKKSLDRAELFRIIRKVKGVNYIEEVH
jgi:GTP pyrophosphokinase